MTIEEFVTALRLTPRDWRLEKRAIRRGDEFIDRSSDRQCPLFAVSGVNMWFGRVESAGAKIGLSKEDSFRIINAADGGHFDVELDADVRVLRAKLLEACGLKEE